MKRCILVCVLLSQSAFGLEFGDPEVQSTQNAPLELHIPLRELGQTSASELFPLLASETEFTTRGMDRPESLSALTYSVASEADETRLVIRSADAWADAELTTLVELFTPDGPRFIPVSVKIPPPQPSARPETQVILDVPNGATLWRLASRVQPEDLTIEQVMMALYDTNAEAFEFDNINALERGAQLRVPPVSVMGLESARDAKTRFDVHMAAPTTNFPRLAARLNALATASAPETEVGLQSSTEVTPDQVEPMPEDVQEADTGSQSPDAASDESVVVTTESAVVVTVQSESESVQTAEAADIEPASGLVAESVMVDRSGEGTGDVDRLIEKITALESKLEQVDEKLEAIASERQVPPVLPAPPVAVEPDMDATITEQIAAIDWDALIEQVISQIPTQSEFEAFRRTEVGQGTLILLGVLVFAVLARQVYGRQSAPHRAHPSVAAEKQPPVMPELPAPTPAPQPAPIDIDVDAPAVAASMNGQFAEAEMPADTSDALDSAIERLKRKIEDPTRASEAESLYVSGADDDALIDAFSADALNENPEWGEDPDDEADIATHQLELAQSYLDMGMKQTAIELLERVAVSPDKTSAMRARTLLDASRA